MWMGEWVGLLRNAGLPDGTHQLLRTYLRSILPPDKAATGRLPGENLHSPQCTLPRGSVCAAGASHMLPDGRGDMSRIAGGTNGADRQSAGRRPPSQSTALGLGKVAWPGAKPPCRAVGTVLLPGHTPVHCQPKHWDSTQTGLTPHLYGAGE